MVLRVARSHFENGVSLHPSFERASRLMFQRKRPSTRLRARRYLYMRSVDAQFDIRGTRVPGVPQKQFYEVWEVSADLSRLFREYSYDIEAQDSNVAPGRQWLRAGFAAAKTMVVKCHETRHVGLRIQSTEREKEVEVVVENMEHGAGTLLLMQGGKSRPRTKKCCWTTST